MTPEARVRAEAEAIFAAFQVAGARPVEAPVLLPAGTLLDLYGEDLRARAYVTADTPGDPASEMMLRPDFTVPVVLAHMAHGADPARYCYRGAVFRRQDAPDAARPREYLQVGYEVFDRDDPVAAEAEVFALFARILAPLGLRAATGDIGLLTAAVAALDTTPGRRALLMRHIWRPGRFRALLDRFAGRAPLPPARAALLDRLAGADIPALVAAETHQGLREPAEIAARAAALVADAATPPLDARQVAAVDALLALEGPAPEALATLRTLAAAMPALGPSVARFADRLAALGARGVDAGRLPFAAAMGQASLEYYDGFVFAFRAADPALPPVASGGRYDALTARLGEGRSIPAVGGVIRPGLVARLREGA